MSPVCQLLPGSLSGCICLPYSLACENREYPSGHGYSSFTDRPQLTVREFSQMCSCQHPLTYRLPQPLLQRGLAHRLTPPLCQCVYMQAPHHGSTPTCAHLPRALPHHFASVCTCMYLTIDPPQPLHTYTCTLLPVIADMQVWT